MDTIDLVNMALAGDKEGFTAAFNDSIAAKVSDALEVKKVEVATNLLNDEEPNDETIEVDGEDGNADAESDVESDSTAEEPADAE